MDNRLRYRLVMDALARAFAAAASAAEEDAHQRAYRDAGMALHAALPGPGDEDEADQVLVFQQVVMGLFESHCYAVAAEGSTLMVLARQGMQAYGGLCAFSDCVARSSRAFRAVSSYPSL